MTHLELIASRLTSYRDSMNPTVVSDIEWLVERLEMAEGVTSVGTKEYFTAGDFDEIPFLDEETTLADVTAMQANAKVAPLLKENKILTYQVDMSRKDLQEIRRCHDEIARLNAALDTSVDILACANCADMEKERDAAIEVIRFYGAEEGWACAHEHTIDADMGQKARKFLESVEGEK